VTPTVLPDSQADPTGYVTAVADEARRTGGSQWIAQSNLWRAVVAAEECFGAAYRPVVEATVAACRAYAGGTQ
jgi:hypothetical protein